MVLVRRGLLLLLIQGLDSLSVNVLIEFLCAQVSQWYTNTDLYVCPVKFVGQAYQRLCLVCCWEVIKGAQITQNFHRRTHVQRRNMYIN